MLSGAAMSVASDATALVACLLGSDCLSCVTSGQLVILLLLFLDAEEVSSDKPVVISKFHLNCKVICTNMVLIMTSTDTCCQRKLSLTQWPETEPY